MPNVVEHRLQVLPWQAEFLGNQNRIHGVIGGLGSGKTQVCCSWLIDRVMKFPHAKHCFAGRDTPQLKRGTIPSIMAEFARRNIKAVHNRSDNTIVVPGVDARLFPLTAENFESFRSLEADSIYADEISDWGPTNEAFVKYLTPRLRPSPEGKAAKYDDLSPQLRFSTNPPETIAHWLYELLEEQHFCTYQQVSVRDNVFLLDADPEYLPMLLRSMSEDEAHVLVDGQWGYAVRGRVYKAFDRRIHLEPLAGLPPIEYIDGLPLQWALDFNVGYMASTISQTFVAPHTIDRRGMDYHKVAGSTIEEMRKFRNWTVPAAQEQITYVIDEIIMHDAGAPDVADEFIRRFGEQARKKGVVIYGDPAGGARSQQISSQSANRSNWGVIFERLRLAGIRFEPRIRMKSSSVGDRIGAFNAHLKAADGRYGMWFHPRCVETIKDVEMVKYVEGTNDLDKKSDPERTHVSDALGYQIEFERAVALRQRLNRMTSFK
jgi:hypothetical protein